MRYIRLFLGLCEVGAWILDGGGQRHRQLPIRRPTRMPHNFPLMVGNVEIWVRLRVCRTDTIRTLYITIILTSCT